VDKCHTSICTPEVDIHQGLGSVPDLRERWKWTALYDPGFLGPDECKRRLTKNNTGTGRRGGGNGGHLWEVFRAPSQGLQDGRETGPLWSSACSFFHRFALARRQHSDSMYHPAGKEILWSLKLTPQLLCAG
jgi:hypothetical protein